MEQHTELWCVVCDRPLDDDEEMTCDGVCKQILRMRNTGQQRYRASLFLLEPSSVFATKKWMPWSDLQVVPTDFDILDADRFKKQELRRI